MPSHYNDQQILEISHNLLDFYPLGTLNDAYDNYQWNGQHVEAMMQQCELCTKVPLKRH